MLPLAFYFIAAMCTANHVESSIVIKNKYGSRSNFYQEKNCIMS